MMAGWRLVGGLLLDQEGCGIMTLTMTRFILIPTGWRPVLVMLGTGSFQWLDRVRFCCKPPLPPPACTLSASDAYCPSQREFSSLMKNLPEDCKTREDQSWGTSWCTSYCTSLLRQPLEYFIYLFFTANVSSGLFLLFFTWMVRKQTSSNGKKGDFIK